MTDRVPAIRVCCCRRTPTPTARSSAASILSNIDLASAVEARKMAPHQYVTKAMREVEFHEPVYIGDLVSFYTETVRVGRTSVTCGSRSRPSGGAADRGQARHRPRRERSR